MISLEKAIIRIRILNSEIADVKLNQIRKEKPEVCPN